MLRYTDCDRLTPFPGVHWKLTRVANGALVSTGATAGAVAAEAPAGNSAANAAITPRATMIERRAMSVGEPPLPPARSAASPGTLAIASPEVRILPCAPPTNPPTAPQGGTAGFQRLAGWRGWNAAPRKSA